MAHCNHCDSDFKSTHDIDALCSSCFIAGHRGSKCSEYCRTDPPQTDPRIPQALALIYDVDQPGVDQ